MSTRLFSCEYRSLSAYMWVVYAWVMIGRIDDSIIKTATVVSVNGAEEILHGSFHICTGLFSYVHRAVFTCIHGSFHVNTGLFPHLNVCMWVVAGGIDNSMIQIVTVAYANSSREV